MQREAAAFLWDAHEAAGLIREFVSGRNFETFSASALICSAVERQFEIIGEAFSKIAPEIAGQIPELAQIVGFRNVLIHGYAVLDKAVVWKVIQKDLGPLEEAVQRLLAKSPPPDATS
jgi:uncharacterized protein with HEPN domain